MNIEHIKHEARELAFVNSDFEFMVVEDIKMIKHFMIMIYSYFVYTFCSGLENPEADFQLKSANKNIK